MKGRRSEKEKRRRGEEVTKKFLIKHKKGINTLNFSFTRLLQAYSFITLSPLLPVTSSSSPSLRGYDSEFQNTPLASQRKRIYP
jgi:hypothetical protein